MNFHHLAVFHAVAETGGVTAGAERLQISQPAASKQIRKLESALGVALFDRVGRGLRLTEPGRVLAGYTRRCFALESEAERAVGELRVVRRGTLLIGASTTIGSYLFPAVLAVFHRDYPGVRVHVEVGNTEQIQRGLLDHRLDVGLTEGLVAEAGLTSWVFAHDELVGIAAPDHLAAGRIRLKAQDFVGYPFVMREQGSGTRAVIELALSAVGLGVAPVMTLGSTEGIKRGVTSGIGVSIVSRLSVLSEEAAGTLKVVTLSDLKIPRPMHWVRLQDLGDGPTFVAFDRVLTETLPAGFRP